MRYGAHNGFTVAFLLTPVPEPGTLGLLAAGLIVLAVRARQLRRG